MTEQRTIGSGGGKKAVIAKHNAEKKYFYSNPDTTTWVLGQTYKFSYKIDKQGRYPVLDDLKLRFKCKNSSANDTYDYESMWHFIESMKIRLNGKECYTFKDNLTREAFALRKLMMESKEAVQQREYVLTRGDGTGFHNSAAIAVSTTSEYYYVSFNDVCDIFHDLRLCPIREIDIEMTTVSGTATELFDYISYDNSTGSEALTSYFSLVNVDLMFEISYYNTPQIKVAEYMIPTVKYDKRDYSGTDLTTNYIRTASQSYTIDLSTGWHDVNNITKVHLYGRDASADNSHKQYLGLGVISRLDLKKAGKTEYQFFSQYHLLEHINDSRRAALGKVHWLLPNDSWVSGEEIPFMTLDFTGRNRFLGDGIHAHEGINNKTVLNEIVLYNDALTDANMTRLAVILESKHYIKINVMTGRVTEA